MALQPDTQIPFTQPAADALATQTGLSSRSDELRRLLLQFKEEFFVEQKTFLEKEGVRLLTALPNARLTPHVAKSGPAPTGTARRRFSVSQAGDLPGELYKDEIPNSSSPADSFASQDPLKEKVDKASRDKANNVSPDDDSQDQNFEQENSVLHSSTKETLGTRKFGNSEILKGAMVEARTTLDQEQMDGISSDGITKKIYSLSLWRDKLQDVVKDPAFDAVCGLIICFNAILVGIETEFLAQEGSTPQSVDNLQLVLNTWYLVELLMRLTAQGWAFLFGDEKKWNLFDAFLVTSSIVDLFLTNINISNFKAARILRAVRLFRIIRTLRIIRSLKYVREFRKMVYSLVASIQTLFWSLLLVFGVMYAFALWFTQSAAYFKLDVDSGVATGISDMNELRYYSSFGRTIYTLFAAISGGYSWHVVVDPWIETGSFFTVLLFFSYVSIAVFGLLNIVTSVFVESAMHATQHFQDLLVDAKKKDLEMYTYHMRRIFEEIDQDRGGTISFKEMRIFLSDHNSELPQYLEALGISSSDVWVLFKLLDKDGSGNIDVHEFCEGCLRLKGEARSFDINCMIYESRAMIRYQSEFMEFVEEKFEGLEIQNTQLLLRMDKPSETSVPHRNKSSEMLPRTKSSEMCRSRELSPTKVNFNSASVDMHMDMDLPCPGTPPEVAPPLVIRTDKTYKSRICSTPP